MFFEAGSPLKLKLEKILAFLLCSRSRSFTQFLAKVTMKKVWDGGPPAKRSRRSPTGAERMTQTTRIRRRSTSTHGKEKIWRNRRAGCPQERKKPGAFMSCHSKTAFFSSQQKFKVEQSFSMGLSVGWAIDREARKLSGATGAKRQSWAEHRNEATKLSEAMHRSEATKLSGARGAKRQSWAERKCPSNAGLDS